MNRLIYTGVRAVFTPEDLATVANGLGCEVAALRAVLEVECRGSGFYTDGRLTMLYEPHIAYRYATAAVRKELMSAGIGHPVAGVLKYPGSAALRYQQFEQCALIGGVELACIACSWGLPQGMGFNHKAFGYDSAQQMVKAFAEGGEREQLAGMGRFIAANPRMHRALIAKNWPLFAQLYNGPAYAKNRYDEKLASSYLKFRPRTEAAKITRLLKRGMKGEDVRVYQLMLSTAGFVVDVDGDFGRITEQETRAFQSANRLVSDGIAGPKTIEALEALTEGKIINA